MKACIALPQPLHALGGHGPQGGELKNPPAEAATPLLRGLGKRPIAPKADTAPNPSPSGEGDKKPHPLAPSPGERGEKNPPAEAATPLLRGFERKHIKRI
jgi:hypothetical protein